MKFGTVRQTNSQDTDPNLTCFGWRPIRQGKTERFVSVLVPHTDQVDPRALAASIETQINDAGDSNIRIGGTQIGIKADGKWSVLR